MKIKSNLHAGYSSYSECKADLDYWKTMAEAMDTYSKTGQWPAGLPYPVAPTPPPTTSGGGYVNGIYYPDYSGYCG